MLSSACSIACIKLAFVGAPAAKTVRLRLGATVSYAATLSLRYFIAFQFAC